MNVQRSQAGRGEAVSEHVVGSEAGNAAALPVGERHSSSRSCQLLPQPSSSGITAEHDEKQVLETSTSSQAKGMTKEKRKADCTSRFPPEHVSVSHPAVAHEEQRLDILQRTPGEKIILPALLVSQKPCNAAKPGQR